MNVLVLIVAFMVQWCNQIGRHISFTSFRFVSLCMYFLYLSFCTLTSVCFGTSLHIMNALDCWAKRGSGCLKSYFFKIKPYHCNLFLVFFSPLYLCQNLVSFVKTFNFSRGIYVCYNAQCVMTFFVCLLMCLSYKIMHLFIYFVAQFGVLYCVRDFSSLNCQCF